MSQQSIVNSKGQLSARKLIAEIWSQLTGEFQGSTDLLAHEDYVTLADGQVVIVPRVNLAAAKGLLAAQRAAERRVAAQRAAQFADEAERALTSSR